MKLLIRFCRDSNINATLTSNFEIDQTKLFFLMKSNIKIYTQIPDQLFSFYIYQIRYL